LDIEGWRRLGASAAPYFRPPYGSYDRTAISAAGRAGYSFVVLWSVDTRDWERPGSATIANRVLSSARPGSIVLMHVLPQTAAALPRILAGLERKHLRPATLDQLLHLPGARARSGGWSASG
jgi:peptidoglycan-N-acetylglucosamine deacetylase